jgi:hypothetical protein
MMRTIRLFNASEEGMKSPAAILVLMKTLRFCSMRNKTASTSLAFN